MWMVVYVAPNKRVAGILRQLLEMEGILVKLKESVSTTEAKNVEVMVSELEIEEASEVINNALQKF